MAKTIMITIALAALALSAIATKAAIESKTTKPMIIASCDAQIWPVYSENCLLTINGDKSERKFRVVAF